MPKVCRSCCGVNVTIKSVFTSLNCAVPTVPVALQQSGVTRYSGTTNSSGVLTIPSVAPGTYQMVTSSTSVTVFPTTQSVTVSSSNVSTNFVVYPKTLTFTDVNGAHTANLNGFKLFAGSGAEWNVVYDYAGTATIGSNTLCVGGFGNYQCSTGGTSRSVAYNLRGTFIMTETVPTVTCCTTIEEAATNAASSFTQFGSVWTPVFHPQVGSNQVSTTTGNQDLSLSPCPSPFQLTFNSIAAPPGQPPVPISSVVVTF